MRARAGLEVYLDGERAEGALRLAALGVGGIITNRGRSGHRFVDDPPEPVEFLGAEAQAIPVPAFRTIWCSLPRVFRRRSSAPTWGAGPFLVSRRPGCRRRAGNPCSFCTMRFTVSFVSPGSWGRVGRRVGVQEGVEDRLLLVAGRPPWPGQGVGACMGDFIRWRCPCLLSCRLPPMPYDHFQHFLSPESRAS